MSIRLSKEHRRRQILKAGLQLALDGGLYSELVSRSYVARECRVSRPLISHHFNSDIALRKAILQGAIDGHNMSKEERFIIIAQAAAISDPALDDVPKKLVRDALEWLTHSNR